MGTTPQKFRKRPVVIEAYQTSERMEIHTLEGTMTAEPGDWIVTGVKGERYPVKPDIFAASYEPALPGLPEGTSPEVVEIIDSADLKLREAIEIARQRLDPITFLRIITSVNMLVEHYHVEIYKSRAIVAAAIDAAKWRGWSEIRPGVGARKLRELASVIEKVTGGELEEYT